MKNQEGLPTNALYGVLKMIEQISQKRKPDFMICCFDTKEGSFFRKKLYPEYKANRSEMPEDLERQVPYLKLLLESLLIPCFEQAGREADDLIASLVKSVKPKNWETFIVSGDKDFAQIVEEDVFLYDTMKDVIYDPAGVEEKWKLPPSQIKDYLALTGDSSDNIPGVKGIGPKGAVELLKNYNNLESIYENMDHIKTSLQKKLLQEKEMAFLSRKLVDLEKDINVDPQLFEKKYKPVKDFSSQEKDNLKKLLEELGFKSYLKKFFNEGSSPNAERKLNSESEKTDKKPEADTKRKDQALLTQEKNYELTFKGQTQRKTKYKSLTLEEFKNQLEPYSKVQIGIYHDQFYLLHKKSFLSVSKDEFKSLADFLDHKWIRYLGHDLKFFWRILKVKNPVPEYDSMIAGHLVGSLIQPSLRKLFEIHLNVPSSDSLSLGDLFYLEQELQAQLIKKLESEEMKTLYEEIEKPLIPVLYEMETKGFLIDLEEIQKQSLGLKKDLSELEFQIYKMIGESFNISSPKQLGEILFEKLKLPKGRKTKTGWSTDSHELMKIKKLHPVLGPIIEYRELSKLKNTYTEPLAEMRDPKTGRIHTEFKQASVATGRLSSLNPNLQNIPIRTDRGHLIRKVFRAEEGKQLIVADYSQIELRILAEITGDENLKTAFEENLDIHSMTASEIFNVPIDKVSTDLRRKSKAVNFGIAYGQGAYGLAETLSIPRAESKEIIDNYFKKFKRIKDYIESVKIDLTKKNYVKTLYGRKRFFDTDFLKNPRLKSGIERAAINAPLQGTASDIVKKAMIKLNESLPIPILSQVHDELLFECPEDLIPTELKTVQTIMEANDVLKTALKVNLKVGENWFSAKSVSSD